MTPISAAADLAAIQDFEQMLAETIESAAGTLRFLLDTGEVDVAKAMARDLAARIFSDIMTLPVDVPVEVTGAAFGVVDRLTNIAESRVTGGRARPALLH